MIRYTSTLVLFLLFSITSFGKENWHLNTRHSFYTIQKEAELLLHVRDNKLFDEAHVKISINNTDITLEKLELNKEIVQIPLDISLLGKGSFEVRADITIGDFSKTLKTELLILEPKANSVLVDRLNGGLYINDLPWFPFGFYCYSPVQPTLAEEEVVKGFNMMSPYQRISSKTRDERKAYMDRAAELGMKVHYNLLSVSGGGGVGSGRDKNSSETEKQKLLREEIEAFMDHPALLAWYISDEPTGHGADPEELKEIYNFIRSIDPYHPITIVFMAPMQARKYAEAMDIVMADPYPIPNNTAEGVGYVTRSLLKEFKGEMPVWIVPQAFGGSEHWGREPTVQEISVMTYLSLANGATGIQYFIRHGLNSFPKSTAVWGAAGRIALETQDISPFILNGEVIDIAGTDQDNIHLRCWELNGQKLIMAVNENIEPGPLKINFENISDTGVQVLFEDRPEEISNGVLEDYIDGYGRRVYLIGNPENKININPLNMILDPGFEDMATPGVPASCYAGAGADRGATYFTDSRIALEGRHSLRLNSPVANGGNSLGFFPVMVNSGSGYTLSVWAKYDPESFRKEEIKGFWKKLFKKEPDTNRYFTLSLGSIKSAKFALTDQWEKYTMTVYIPENSEESSKINPRLELISQGSAWFDILEMYPDPLIEYGVNIDSHSFEVELSSSQENAIIKYTLDGSKPTVSAPEYSSPVKLTKSADFTAGVFLADTLYNYSTKSFFVHLATGKELNYKRKYSSSYNAGGKYGLVDGIRGSRNYTDKRWQGFLANDMEVIIDLGEKTRVSSATVGCLQDTRSWIFMPSSVSVYGSDDGEYFSILGKVNNEVSQKATGSVRNDYHLTFDTVEFRFIKVIADNIGTCPDWHNGKGQGAYLFVDEIIIN